jgi:hypothetical protein
MSREQPISEWARVLPMLFWARESFSRWQEFTRRLQMSVSTDRYVINHSDVWRIIEPRHIQMVAQDCGFPQDADQAAEARVL